MKLAKQQTEAYDLIMRWVEDKDSTQFLLGGFAGVGKEQPLTSKLLTPTGYIKMGDVKIGTTLSHPYGGTSTVKQIHPQGLKRVYKVHFSDGAVVECGKEHLWELSSTTWKRNKDPRKYRPTPLKDILGKELKNTCKGGVYKYSIPLVDRIDFTEKELPVEPYLLGALIADGSYQNSILLSYHKDDSFIVDKISSLLPEGVEIGSNRFTSENGKQLLMKGMIDIFKETGLWGKYSKERFIPSEYFTSSWEQRFDLLNGLMDCDGSASKTGNKMSYSTKSFELAYNVKDLVTSLGGLGNVITQDRGEKGIDHTVIVKFNTLNPFTLPRKAKRITPRKHNTLKKNIIKIERTNKIVEQQCITVDREDGLYITDDFTVTHNTVLLSFLIKNIQRSVHCCAPTAKAASVLARKLGDGTVVRTIHSLVYTPVPPDDTALREAKTHLDSHPDDEEAQDYYKKIKKAYDKQDIQFAYSDANPIEPGDIVVIDEASMVSERVKHDLERTGCKLLFVGDDGQLPPVKSNDWFKDATFDYQLTDVHRQALESPIIRMSMEVRQGRLRRSQYQFDDCRMVDQSKVKVSELMGCDQIIVGKNATRQKINRLLRSKLKHEGDLPVAGDKLICLKNFTDDKTGINYVNGEQAIALKDTMEVFGDTFMEMDYEGEVRQNVPVYDYFFKHNYDNEIDKLPWYETKMMREFDYAYAVTCHKSQGSEWDNVIILDDKMQAHDLDFRKRWLYTAITRASKQLTLTV